MSGTFILVVVSVLVLIGVAVYFSYLAEKKRAEAFQQAARDLGFEFLPQGDPTLLQKLEGFHLFSLGHSKKLWNLLRGKTRNLEVDIFDYRYVVGGGKNQQTFTHSVVCFRFTGPQLPSFSLRPESVWHKIGSWLGYQDIDFDSHPNFSSHYLLRGDNEEVIRGLFTAPVLEFYEQHPGLSTEGSGNTLLFYRYLGRVSPEKLRPFMEEGFEVLSLFHSDA